MIRTMASPGQESESLNSQFLVDSMPAMIHTARPDGYLDNFTNVGSNTWASLGTTCPSGSVGFSFIARLKGLWPRGERASRPRKIRIRNLGPRGGWEYRWKLHCKVPLRDGRGNSFHVKDFSR